MSKTDLTWEKVVGCQLKEIAVVWRKDSKANKKLYHLSFSIFSPRLASLSAHVSCVVLESRNDRSSHYITIPFCHSFRLTFFFSLFYHCGLLPRVQGFQCLEQLLPLSDLNVPSAVHDAFIFFSPSLLVLHCMNFPQIWFPRVQPVWLMASDVTGFGCVWHEAAFELFPQKSSLHPPCYKCLGRNIQHNDKTILQCTYYSRT